MSSFFSHNELLQIGFAVLGNNVLISRHTSIYSPELIKIGNHVRIDDFCILSGNIELRGYNHIGAFCGLFGKAGIVLEDFSGLSGNCLVYSVSDDYSGRSLTNPTVPDIFKNLKSGPVSIKRHCIIGAGSILLPNITIGEGSAVGALSVVSKNLEEWTVYAGNPIVKIKERERNLLELEHQLHFERNRINNETK